MDSPLISVLDDWSIGIVCLHIIYLMSMEAYAQDRPPQLESESGLHWNSAYVTEGRDNLNGKALLEFQSTLQLDNYSFNLWYGNGYNSAYQELILSLFYKVELGKLDITPGLSHLRFAPRDIYDHELSIQADYPVTTWLSATAYSVYSVRADGSFIELNLVGSFPISERLELSPSISQNFDWGFISPAYDGFNHVGLGCKVNLKLHKSFTLVVDGNYIIAQQDMRNQQLDNHGWGSIGLQSNF